MDNTHFPENVNDFPREAPHEQTKVSFTVEHEALVSIEIYDLSGNKCAFISAKRFFAGQHEIQIDIATLGIPAGKYIYYLERVDQNGLNRECRMMNIG